MSITLGPKQEELIAEALNSGAYQSPEEVIQQALELLHDRDAWLADSQAKIQEGFAAAQRGELLEGDQVRVQIEKRKNAWPNSQRKA